MREETLNTETPEISEDVTETTEKPKEENSETSKDAIKTEEKPETEEPKTEEKPEEQPKKEKEEPSPEKPLEKEVRLDDPKDHQKALSSKDASSTKESKPESSDQQKVASRETQRQERPKTRAADDTVFVGKKPTMAYVLAVVTQFSEDNNEVHLKARGKSISRAVDVAEVVKNKFLKTLKTSINIGTEQIDSDEGRGKINVSTIDIHLTK